MFNFKITAKKGKARTGVFRTPHGEVETPVFMPVGTMGAVKTVAPWELEEIGSEIILGNTYHLYLRPGDQLIKNLGGLHQFMNWPKPILTDSGGFQVYSIGERQKIDEGGIVFKSHLDGSEYKFTPEKTIQIQKNLGADIIMAFDDVAGVSNGRRELKTAMARTHRWLDRCVDFYSFLSSSPSNPSNSQALFGIVQGGLELDLRKKSAEFVASKNLPGNAIGGLAMPGDSENVKIHNLKSKHSYKLQANSYKLKMWQVVKQVCQILPENKPRYLMGVGEPADLVKAISLGCDMFDCVLPTRLARHGTVWTWDSSNLTNYSRINLLNSKFKLDPGRLDLYCSCPTCARGFSRAYLRHLLVAGEMLALRLLTIHNIAFLNRLIQKIKLEINA